MTQIKAASRPVVEYAAANTGGSAMLRLLLTCSMLIAGLPRLSAAAQIGDPVPGEAVARTWCANCHDVNRAPRPPATDAVPSFAAIAAMPSSTSMSLRVFLQSPHAAMPDYHLERHELDDLVAYILSLRGP